MKIQIKDNSNPNLNIKDNKKSCYSNFKDENDDLNELKTLNLVTIKSNSTERWFILILMGLLEFIYLYVLTICQGIQIPLQNKEGLNLSSSEYNLLSSLINYPNIIILLFSGKLVDICEKNKFYLIVSMIFFISQIIFLLGIHYMSFSTMILGRFMFGCIFQTFIIALIKNISSWFSKKEYALAFSIFTSFGRIGLITCGIITPYIYDRFDSLLAPCFIGFILSIVSFFIILISIYIENHLKIKHHVFDNYIHKQNNYINHIPNFKFDKLYWINNISLFFGYASVWGFIFNGNDIISNIFQFSIQRSGYILSLLFIGYIIIALIIGFLIKNMKKLIYYGSLISVLFGFIAFILLDKNNEIFNLLFSIISVVGIGVYYGIFNVSCISFINAIISEDHLANAYGITWSIFSLAQSISLTLYGFIKDNTNDYYWVIFFLKICCLLQVVPSIILITYINYDSKYKFIFK